MSHRRINWGHSAFSALRKKQNVPVHRQAGLTYVEIMIALVVLVVGLLPALDALRSATIGTAVTESYVVEQHRLSGRLEEVLAEPFAGLDTAALAAGSTTVPSSYSEPAATPGRLLVFLSRYDGDDADADGNPFTGVDAGLLWVRAAIEDTVYDFETLVSE
jgi:hypothetical protein